MKNTVNMLAKVDTATFERKLRAIAKHTEALADELKLIDQEVCPLCGSGDIKITKLYGDGKTVDVKYDCEACNEVGVEERAIELLMERFNLTRELAMDLIDRARELGR